jgi:cyclin-dependent kinase 2
MEIPFRYPNELRHDRYSIKFDRTRIREYIPRKISEFRYIIQDACIPNPIQNLKTYNYKDRQATIEWMFVVNLLLKFLPDTFFITVNFFDRCLTSRDDITPAFVVNRNNSLLTICACSYLSAKINELYFPGSGHYIALANGSFTEAEFLDYEKKVLITLGGYITQPTIMDFIRLNNILLDDNVEMYISDAGVHECSKLLAQLATTSAALCIPGGTGAGTGDGTGVLTFQSGKTICHPSSIAAGCSYTAHLLLHPHADLLVPRTLLCEFNNLQPNELAIISDFVIAAAKMTLRGIRPSQFYFQELQDNFIDNPNEELIQAVDYLAEDFWGFSEKSFIDVIKDHPINHLSPPEDLIHSYIPSPLVQKFKMPITETEHLDNYYVKNKLIGFGTHAKVYNATSVQNPGVKVAIKISTNAEDGVPVDTLREITTGITVNFHNCPSTLKLQEFIIENGRLPSGRNRQFCLITSLESANLGQFLIEDSYKKDIMFQIAESIHCLHTCGIMHRDLKPQNILAILADDLIQIRIADFGSCRSVSLPIRKYTHEVISLWYRPPEILLGAYEYDFSVDIWSLGCVFYQILTGEVLFRGKNEIDQVNKIFAKLGKPDETIWRGAETLPGYFWSVRESVRIKDDELFPGVDESGRKLISWMLRYDPKERPDIGEVMNDEYFSGFEGQAESWV